jgi:hypothetical protein
MKSRARSLLLVSIVLLISASSSPSYPQSRKNIESLPKLLTVREQQIVRELAEEAA